MDKMNPEVKQLWIEDLRANSQLQGKGCLRSEEYYGDHGEQESYSYCCLGRLCELFKQQTRNGEWLDDTIFRVRNEDGSEDASSGFLPYPVQQWAGLNTNNPFIDGEDTLLVAATYCNDSLGWDFLQIADAIEKNL